MKALSVLYTTGRSRPFEQMVKHVASRSKDEKSLKKNFWENDPLPAKFGEHRSPLLELFKEFNSIWDGHSERINFAKLRIDFVVQW